MRFALLCVFAFSFICSQARASVYEFNADGTVISYEAVDYLSREHKKHTFTHPKIMPILKRGFDEYVQEAAQKYHVNPTLVHAVIQTESSYNPDAVSPKGAMGLMQLMPSTADRYNVRNAFDPAQNISGGVQYLSELLKHYDQNVALSLAAYNAGEGAVDKYKGIPPYPETEQYVSKILNMIEP